MVEPKRQINAKKNECKLINRFNPLWFHPRSASLVISSSSTALMPCLQAKPQSHKVIRLSMPSIGQSHKEFQILPACGRWRHHQTKLAWEMCRGPKCEALCNFVNLLSQDWTLYGILQVFCSTVFAWNFMKHIFQGFKPCSGSVFQLVFLLRFHAEALAGYQVPEADLPGAFRIEPWKLWKTLARKRKKARAPTTKPMAHKPITFYILCMIFREFEYCTLWPKLCLRGHLWSSWHLPNRILSHVMSWTRVKLMHSNPS